MHFILLGHWELTVAALLSLGIASLSDPVLHSGNILSLLLELGRLTILIGWFGRKARYLIVLSLVLISFRLVILAVLLLLLLRELPLKLMLMRTLVLVLISLRVTLLELLRWISWETGTAAALGLRSTNLALLVFHLLALPLSHYCSINQMLEGRKSMVHQLVV
jgi:hypothetical protein